MYQKFTLSAIHSNKLSSHIFLYTCGLVYLALQVYEECLKENLFDVS